MHGSIAFFSGQETVDYIHAVFLENKRWVQHSLAIPPLLPAAAFPDSGEAEPSGEASRRGRAGTRTPKLNLDIPEHVTERKNCRLNPLEAYVRIGQEHFTHVSLLKDVLKQEL